MIINLTLTSVVFEFNDGITTVTGSLNLTLTSVVFEYIPASVSNGIIYI